MTKNEKWEALMAFINELHPGNFNYREMMVEPYHIEQFYGIEKPRRADIFGWLPIIFPSHFEWVKIHNYRIDVLCSNNSHLDKAVYLSLFLEIHVEHVEALFFGYRTLQHFAGVPFTDLRDLKAVRIMFQTYYEKHIKPQ